MKYDIIPCPKPRMTQRDKWKKRPCVLKYNAFKDECRLKDVWVGTSGSHVIFTMPMPESWSNKKKERNCGLPHHKRPDIDNLLKALLDAVYNDDSCVDDIRITKKWGQYGMIEIRENVDD